MEISSKNYAELAGRTESFPDIKVFDRLADSRSIRLIAPLLEMVCETGGFADVMKRFSFYGAPLETLKEVDVYSHRMKLGTIGPAITDRMYDPKMVRILHAIFGMATETAELAEVASDHLLDGKPFDMVNLEEELGDLLWYVALLCSVCGFSLEEVMRKNIAKLSARYPDAFKEEDALNRDLPAERKILED